MTAQNIFDIAIHLPEKEMEKLLDMLDKKVNAIPISKRKTIRNFTDKEAIDYLLKNVFSKGRTKNKSLNFAPSNSTQ